MTTLMHWHRYRDWREYSEYEQCIDGRFAYDVTVWIGFCQVCGRPKERKVKH